MRSRSPMSGCIRRSTTVASSTPRACTCSSSRSRSGSLDLLYFPDGLARLAAAVAERLGLGGDGIDAVFRAGATTISGPRCPRRSSTSATRWTNASGSSSTSTRSWASASSQGSPAFRSVAPIVRSSHESGDRSGYPDGLHGEEIPLPARIIRVCDAFIAMTSKRPYRDAPTVAAALRESSAEAGSHFDPTCVSPAPQVLEAPWGRARRP